jgi:hypothetical protein
LRVRKSIYLRFKGKFVKRVKNNIKIRVRFGTGLFKKLVKKWKNKEALNWGFLLSRG